MQQPGQGISEMGGPDMGPDMGGPRGDRRGGGPGGPGATGWGFMGPPPTEAQEKDLLEFLKGNEPALHAHLVESKAKLPDSYKRRLAEIWNMYRDPDTRDQFVKSNRAHRAVRDLMDQYKKADAKDKDALKAKLEKAVGELFDANLNEKELQVKKMQIEMSKLNEKIARRRQQKEKYVARHLEMLTGDDEDWQW